MSEEITKQMKRVEKFGDSREYFYFVEQQNWTNCVEILLEIRIIINRIIS